MLKNISLPLFHRRGMSREGGSVFTTQFHLSLPPYLRVVLTYLFCFFSSRRRHTSLTCDWSSDVCSSDLESVAGHLDTAKQLREQAARSQHDAAEEARKAARELSEDGVTLRDIGRLMGVSYQRAHQLVTNS